MKKVNPAISLWNLSHFYLGKEAMFGTCPPKVYSLESLRSLKSLYESLFDERRLVAEGSWDLTLLKLDGRLDLNL